MPKHNPRALFCLVLCPALWMGLSNSAVADSASVLQRLVQRVDHWQSSMEAIHRSADQAASGALAGGRLIAVGPQPGFATEAYTRAGGLMMTKRAKPGAVTDLTAHDTILGALTGQEDDAAVQALKNLIERAAQANAQVIVFADGKRPRTTKPLTTGEHVTLLPNQVPDSVDVPVTAISNVIGMWAWTGAFIDCSVVDGAMPCVYQSYLLPGGRKRGAMLEKHFEGRFHKQSNVRPEDAAGLGKRYLQTVKTALQAVMTQEADKLQQAANLLGKTQQAGDGEHGGGGGRGGYGAQVFARGHLFPEMVQTPSMPDGWSASRKAGKLKPNQAAIVLEYQAFPWALVEKITAKPRVCIVTSSQRSLPVFTHDPKHVYIDPHWPIHDGAVPLKGYDVPVLPTSGVMDAAVYWQLVEESHLN